MSNNNIANGLTKKTQAAFTLLEVLIAVAIIAVVVTGAYMTFGDSKAGHLKNHAYRLLGQLQIAQEESIIRGVEFGVRIEEDGYFFMIYNNEKWQPLEDHELLKEQKFEDEYQLYVHVEGQESLLQNTENEDDEEKESSESEQEIADDKKKQLKTPQIFMLSSGEMNEFKLTIGYEQNRGKFYRILGNYLGVMKVSPRPLEGHFRRDWDKDLDDDWANVE